MKKTVITILAGAVTLALGIHSATAADMKMNADSKIDQKPMQQTGSGTAPIPGWEKLSKNKHMKSSGSDKSMHNGADMKADSKAVPESQGGGAMKMPHDGKNTGKAGSNMHKDGMSDKGQGSKMKSGAAKPAMQGGAMPMQHNSSDMKTDSNVVPVGKGEMPKSGM